MAAELEFDYCPKCGTISESIETIYDIHTCEFIHIFQCLACNYLFDKTEVCYYG